MNHFLRSLGRLFALSSAVLLALSPLASRATDLSITVGNFKTGATANRIIGKAGATITIGQLLYFDSGAGTWKLADADVSATASQVGGIAASAAASGQDVIIVTEDNDLTLGATLSMATPVYVVSATAGGIAPSADIAAGMYPSVVLIAKSTTKCVFKAGALRGTAVAVAP